jgi:hypothetical protein
MKLCKKLWKGKFKLKKDQQQSKINVSKTWGFTVKQQILPIFIFRL